MSTIAYRDGVMAADTGSWHAGVKHDFALKIATGPDGTLYGAVGDAAQCSAVMRWVHEGCVGPMPEAERTENRGSSFTVMAVPPNGMISLISAYGTEAYPAPYFAIGGGAEVAFGALHAGADAADAIRAAIDHSEYATGFVRLIEHPKPNKTGEQA
jgi:ATP-dependent HslUV protease subunit HslV